MKFPRDYPYKANVQRALAIGPGGIYPSEAPLSLREMTKARQKSGKFLDRVAEESGVAIAVLDENSDEAAASNNNSMCAALYTSPEFSADCARFCGRAFANVWREGKPVEFQCHAGLHCKALPVKDGGRQFVAIIGRTFVKAENYRTATEKAITGKWRGFVPSEFFENVLISGSESAIEIAAKRLDRFVAVEKDSAAAPVDDAMHLSESDAAAEEASDSADAKTAAFANLAAEIEEPAAAEKPRAENDLAAWRALFGSLMNQEYRHACASILEFIEAKYGFETQIWLERRDDSLESVVSRGRLKRRLIRVGILAEDERLVRAAGDEAAVRLVERSRPQGDGRSRSLFLFPVRVGSDIRSALAVECPEIEKEKITELARFAQAVGPQLEILRLRDEVSRHDWVSRAVKKFNEGLGQIDEQDFWMNLTQISAELLGAERASLLVNREKYGDLEVRAAIGAAVDLERVPNLGSRIARIALEKGAPVVAADFRSIGLPASPPEWRYRTSSFISFPIMIGDRRLAVMNFTDRAGRDDFDERDVDLLRTIAPQIAVAIDHEALKDKAGELQQLSLTDPLTGLLNRRYLEERLSEEINRARRRFSEICLLMIDVDYFKSYNDSFGHTAGDTALRLVANALKESLRAADVAARYGGEEFSILLPQTSTEEAAIIADRIRMSVEKIAFPKRRVTISIGIAAFFPEFAEPKDWISAADSALYEAKGLGRNRVCVYDRSEDLLTGKIN